MWNHASTELPSVVTFNDKFDAIRKKFRDNTIGGLSSVFHRHLDLSGGTTSPFYARHTPNGSPLTHAIFLDFNRYDSYRMSHTLKFS